MDSFIIPFLFMFVAFYFLIIRPQQKKAAQHQELINSIKIGDEVLLSSGLYGKVSSYEADKTFFHLEIAPNIPLKIEKQEIAQKLI